MEPIAYTILIATLVLILARPRIGRFRLPPSIAGLGGVAAMVALGLVRAEDFEVAARDLWSPFVTIAAIMVMTEVAVRVGLLELWAARIEARTRSATQTFTLIYCVGVLTSATLNNDAAILLMTPLALALVRRRHPGRPELLQPVAFAVFMSAGVAPLPVSNPMNMVVAEIAGIEFNAYVLRMFPVAVACWVLGYVVLRWVYASRLRSRSNENSDEGSPSPPATSTVAQRRLMLVLVLVLLSYPVCGSLGGPMWIIALGGALASLVLARRYAQEQPLGLVVRGISWETLAFLFAVLILALGLARVGLVDRLAASYADAGVGQIGVSAALGSALLNNHPMSYLNLLSLRAAGSDPLSFLAALVGGDLGPRLLPMGSLAGLLWLEQLRRGGVELPLTTFVRVGVIVTLPSLAVGLVILSLFG